MFELIMKAAADSLLDLARDPKWLGAEAQLGITTVLHTWTRELAFHPHVHCIVTGGGLATDGNRWVAAASEFLFPVHVLAALFRGKVLDGLARARREGRLLLAPEDQGRAARRRTDALHRARWVVYAKRPFGGAEQVYRYLGRYTHRVAISNARILRATRDAVTFRTRGDATATLPVLVFLRRFLLRPTGGPASTAAVPVSRARSRSAGDNDVSALRRIDDTLACVRVSCALRATSRGRMTVGLPYAVTRDLPHRHVRVHLLPCPPRSAATRASRPG